MIDLKAEKIICYSNEEKDKKCEGIITKENDNTFLLKLESANLEDIGFFRSTKVLNGEINGEKVHIDRFLILGYGSQTQNGKTIFNCEYKVYNFLSGVNCFEPNHLKFDNLMCKFNNFETWVKNFSFYGISEEEHLESLSKTKFGKERIDRYEVNNEFSICVAINGSGLYNFHEECTLYIEKENASYDYLYHRMIKISKLLSMFCSTATEPKNPIVLFTNDKQRVATIKGKQWVEDKELYLPFVINYDEVKPYFGKILNNYFRATDKIQLAIDMINTSYYYSEAPGAAINTFLNVTKAIESIYDSDMFNFSEKENEQKLKTKELIKNENVSSKIKKMLNNALFGLYKIPFEERLKQLFNDSQNNLSSKSKESINYLAKLIADTRNYYTHLEKKEGVKIIDETDLDVVSQVLRVYCNIRIIKYLSEGYDDWKCSMKLFARNTLENYCIRTIKDEE